MKHKPFRPARAAGAVSALSLLATLAGLPASASAQPAFPDRAITLIVPFGPGGTSDIIARFLQQPLSEALGQPVVIDNRAGAGGAIGMSALARAPADGHTIGLSVIGPEMLQPLLKKTGYAPESFDHLCGTYDAPLMMIVRPDAPEKTLADVLARARAQPDRLAYGSSGTGTVLHLSMEMLFDRAGARGLHVPYKSSGEMVTGLLGRQVEVFNETPAISTQYKLRGLAVFADRRLPAFPDVPTAAESGMPLQASVWGGLIAPKGLPLAVRQKLEAACRAAAHSDAYRQQADKVNTPLVWRDGRAYEAFVKAEQLRYGGLIKSLGLDEKQ